MLVFGFSASGRLGEINRGRSLDREIDIAGLAGIDDQKRRLLQQIKTEAGGLWAWGSRPHQQADAAWRDMSAGDIALGVYDGHYHYVMRVVRRWDRQDSELASAIWDCDNQPPFTLIFFVDRPRLVNPPVSVEAISRWLPKKYWTYSRARFKRSIDIGVDRFLEQKLGVCLSSTAPTSGTNQ